MQESRTTTLEKTDLYEQDFYVWTQQQVELLLNKRFHELDIENLAEEVATIGRSEHRAVISNLSVLLVHLLKYQFQPKKRSRSWRLTLLEHRKRLQRSFKESPSLLPCAQQELSSSYSDARDLAAVATGLALQTFPEACPYSFEEILDADFLPAAASGSH